MRGRLTCRMQKNDVSIKEIAKLSHVSIATVSRVINSNGRFSRETEERVKRIIDEYNYVPSMLAKGLRINKVQIVGIIVPDITNEFFARMTLEIQKNLFDQGYSTIICNTNELKDIEQRHVMMLRAQKVSGLVYISSEYTDDKNLLINIPTVYIDRKPPFSNKNDSYVFIESDNVQGGYMATSELLNKGCRNIAIIMYKHKISSHNGRYAGYQKAISEGGQSIDDRLRIEVDEVSPLCAYEKTKLLIKSGVEFDGIFCNTDLLAVGAIRALDECGIRIPEDVKVIGFDDISISECNFKPITSVRQPISEIGRLAVVTLIAMANGEKITDHHYLLPVELIRRSSS